MSDLYDIPPEIKAIMAQMGPTDEDKKKALSHGLLSAGFGILANAANNPWVAVGKGGSQGLLGYQQELQQGAQQRAQNLSAASQIQGLGRRTQMDGIINNAIQNMFGGQQTTGQTAPPSNGANVVTTPLTSGGQPGQPIPQDQGPPPQGMPQAGGPPPMSRDAMAKLGTLMALAKGGDITSANNFMFPKAFAARANAPIVDEAGRVINPNPLPPQGSSYDPSTNSFKPVEGGKQAFMAAEAAKAAAQASIKPAAPRVDPRTGEQFVPPGSELQQSFPDGRMPDGVPNPFSSNGYGTPPQILDGLQKTESGGNQYAINKSTKAMGPYQFMPETVAALHQQGIKFDPFDPDQARAAADYYMQQKLAANGGDMNKALASYGGFVTKDPSSYISRVTGLGASQKEEQTATGKYLSDQAAKVDDQAQYAQLMKGRIAELKSLSQNFTPGALTPMKEKLGSLLQGMGMDPDTVASKIGSVGDMQAFNKLAIQMAFDATKQLTNRPAASEVMLQLKANPSLALSPKGTELILGYMDGLADWQLKKQEAKDQWISAKGSYRGFEGEWAKNEPLTKYVPSVSKQDTSDAGSTTVTVNGKPYTFPSASAAQAFRKQAGIQ